MESKYIAVRRSPPYAWTLEEPLVFLTDILPEADVSHEYFHIGTDGVMTIAKGYSFDGVTGFPDLDCMMRGAAGHDVALQAIQLDLLDRKWKERADRLLIRLCAEDGLWKVMQLAVYQAVKRFGTAKRKDLNKYREVKVFP
jgi:hypothetical protein